MIERVVVSPEPLTADGFRDFGTVIDTQNAEPIQVNQGFAQRYDDLVNIDVSHDQGDVKVSLFVAQPRPAPIAITVMERHPLGSQAFVPMQDRPWLVVVCREPLVSSSYRCFRAAGRQGVNYARGCWHHPLLVFDRDSHFTIVDRKGPGKNLEEVWLPDHLRIEVGC